MHIDSYEFGAIVIDGRTYEVTGRTVEEALDRLCG